MKLFQFFRYFVWFLVLGLGGFLGYSFFDDSNTPPTRSFEAVRSDGTPITNDDLLGRPHLTFFGYTHCPDICPTTLFEVGVWLERLGEDGNSLDAYFVTVDPERDTAEHLNDYLTAFDSRITGITGSPEQIAGVMKAWGVFAEKEEQEDGDYLVTHTASVFLVGADGRLEGTVALGESSDVAVQKLRRLVGGADGGT